MTYYLVVAIVLEHAWRETPEAWRYGSLSGVVAGFSKAERKKFAAVGGVDHELTDAEWRGVVRMLEIRERAQRAERIMLGGAA